MNHEFCVLFVHHELNDVVRDHYERIVRFSNGAPIVPLTDGGDSTLPNTIDVAEFPSCWSVENKWFSVDTVLYRWFMNRKISAKRYIYLEWDCLVYSDIQEFYQKSAKVWDADLAARDVKRMPKDSSWYWYSHFSENREPHWPGIRSRLLLPDSINTGIAPLACMLISHRALAGAMPYLEKSRYKNIFCENRIASAVVEAGFQPTRMDAVVRENLKWDTATVPSEPWGIYHAVKSL